MEETLLRISRQLDEKRFGKFRGFVVDAADPEKRGRLKLRIPSVLGDAQSSWALPCAPFGGGAGFGLFAVPPVDSQVWVEFEEGDINRPVWVGTFWQTENDVPEEAAKDDPTTYLLQTPGGHRLQMDDEAGAEAIKFYHSTEAQFRIDENGSCTLTDAAGSRLNLDAENGECLVEDQNGNTITLNSSGITLEDANGNTIEMGASGIKLTGQQIIIEGSQVALGGQGGEPVIKGTTLLTLLATHTHPSAMGPTGPPIPQGESSALSTNVMGT